MKPITLNIKSWPYIGEPLTAHWKEYSTKKSRRGYWFMGFRTTKTGTDLICKFMDPRGELRFSDYTEFCRIFKWEDKEPIFYEAT